ncbi:Ger(x)C family spore germination protein [Bacillus sp. V2I10]|uniref:Ger(x)C family spore germination protein n=1 Tax=Bacillus sp. V2I10 TaxID=3042276 RepID=UPI0027D77ED3|nr:Ger(x)C family spore germination protein [Bacillus sp. V2I10]
MEKNSRYLKGEITTKRKWLIALILILTLFMAAGCWNRIELNEIAISVALGIDKEGDKILISDQVVIPGAIASKTGGGSETPVTLYKESGDGIQQAARRMTTKSSRKIFVGHLQMLILSEEIAKEGIADILDHVTRDHEYRKDFYVVVAREIRAEDALKILTPIEKVPATQMRSSLETSHKAWAGTGAVKIDQLTSDLISKGKEPILTGITLQGNLEGGMTDKIENTAILQYKGLAVFKKDKLVGWLDEEETKGYNYIRGDVKSTSGLIPCNEKENATIEILSANKKIKLKMEHGKPQIDLNIRLEGNVSDAQCSIDFSNPQSFLKLEKKTEKRLIEIIKKALNKAQKEYEADIFGFGEVINRKNPKYWEKVEKDWDKEFADLKVNVKATVKIQRIFKTQKSFRERIKE